MESDVVYFARRAEEERIAADKALHSKARRAHLELAELYAGLASVIEGRTDVDIIGVASPLAPQQ